MPLTPNDGTTVNESSAVRSKLNQVAYNYFTKTAHTVVLARSAHSSSFAGGTTLKTNKWFNLDLPEVQDIRENLRQWKNIDVTLGSRSQPSNNESVPPLVIEVFLDLRNLRDQQSLVYVDPSGRSHSIAGGARNSEIVLERWVVEFRPTANRSVSDLRQDDLPVIYKKAIVLLRSLYTYLRLLPAWDLVSSLSSRAKPDSGLQVDCRIVNGSQPISSKGRIGLTKSLGGAAHQAQDHLDTLYLAGLNAHVGELQLSVSYRKHVDFRVGDSEAILSNHFRTIDGTNSAHSRPSSIDRSSLKKDFVSPLIRDHYREMAISREGSAPSVSFIKPFKSPSINASPDSMIPPGPTGTPSSTSTGGPSPSSPRRSSFTRIPSNSSLAAQRIPRRTMSVTSTSSNVSTSTSASGPKYSSSFGNRNLGSLPKHMSQHYGGIRNISPGSAASSLEQPGSSLYIPNEDLGDFVKMIDSASFGEASLSNSNMPSTTNNSNMLVFSGASANAMAAGSEISPSDQLAKFKSLKASHASLTESITSSFHQSVGAAGKPPSESSASHTPAVPSRLSEEFVVDERQATIYSRRGSKGQFITESGPVSSGDTPADSGGPTNQIRPSSGSSNASYANALNHQQRRSLSPSSVSARSPYSDRSSSPSELNMNHLLMLQSRRSYSPRYSPSPDVNKPTVSSSPREHSASPRLRSPVLTSAPLDIPGPYTTAISRNRPESSSLSNQRTMGYSDLQPSYEGNPNPHSVGPSAVSVPDSGISPFSYSSGTSQAQRTGLRNPVTSSYKNAGNVTSSSHFQPHPHRLSQDYSPRLTPSAASRRYSEGRSSALQMAHNSYEDDDLLFAMSDMHVTGKNDNNQNY